MLLLTRFIEYKTVLRVFSLLRLTTVLGFISFVVVRFPAACSYAKYSIVVLVYKCYVGSYVFRFTRGFFNDFKIYLTQRTNYLFEHIFRGLRKLV